MKITINKQQLITALNIAMRAISSKPSNPILECILINSFKDKGTTISATNLEIGITTKSINSEILEEGSIAVESKLFYDIIRFADGENINIFTDIVTEKNIMTDEDVTVTKVKITSGKSNFEILSQNIAEYPNLPDIEKDNEYKIKEVVLKNMIKQTIFSIAVDSVKPMLTGELLEFKENSLHVIAVDGFRISFRKNELTKYGEPKEVVILGKNLNELMKILSQDEEKEANIYIENDYILFQIEAGTIICRLMVGDFIRYGQSFSDDYTTEIKISKNQLIQSLERAQLLARDSKKEPVILNIFKDHIEIHGKSDIGSLDEEIECEMEGEEMVIGFNPRYLIDPLKVIDDEFIKINFMSPILPSLILPIEGDSFKYLVLPLRQ